MKISRIEVEEGWLDGLDLKFSDGLNVLIGPRGTGKTSIIELIRFCLGIPAYSDDIGQTARNHALTILGSGQVALTIDSNGQEVFLSRTREQYEPVAQLPFPQPILLSQNEIEKVALQDRGKLRLIDTFITSPASRRVEETSLLAKIESFTVQMQSKREEITTLDDRLAELSSIDADLESAETEQLEHADELSTMQGQQKELENLAESMASLAVKIEYLQRATDTLEEFRGQLVSLVQFPPSLELWPVAAGPEDEVSSVRQMLDRAAQTIEAIQTELTTSQSEMNEIANESKARRVQLEKRARALRQEIDTVQKGAGALAHRIADLKESKGQREALTSLREERVKDLQKIRLLREQSLNEVDALREAKYVQRRETADDLNSQLSPLIKISLLRSGIYDAYEAAISETFRGTGIHYNVLAPTLASKMSPRELGEAIEAGDAERVSEATGITFDQAQRLVLAGQTTGVQKVLSCIVEDSPILELFVGTEYKRTERLSTGQRCTVILPILLSDHGRALIIDQPEDNLDNAFIVESVVKAIRLASSKNQIICSTHNPNIPVLGEANRVIFLARMDRADLSVMPRSWTTPSLFTRLPR